MNKNTILCPNCKTPIDVSEVLYKQIDEKLQEKYQKELLLKESELQNKFGDIEREWQKIEEERL